MPVTLFTWPRMFWVLSGSLEESNPTTVTRAAIGLLVSSVIVTSSVPPAGIATFCETVA